MSTQPALRDLDELAALNPGMDTRGLIRLQLQAELLDEDDAAWGYLEPGEDEETQS